MAAANQQLLIRDGFKPLWQIFI